MKISLLNFPAATVVVLCLLSQSRIAAGWLFGERDVIVKNEGEAEAVPVEVVSNPTLVELPVRKTVSGEWTAGGLNIRPSNMVVHDLFFYVQSSSIPLCKFSMNYVIDNVQSRTVRQWSLVTGSSAEVHWEAGILASELRFGTSGGSNCVRNWMAVGFEGA